MKNFKGILSFVAASILIAASQNVSAIQYTFTQDGYSEGATITGMFDGVDLDHDGQLVYPVFTEITNFSMSFSGNSLVPSFSLTYADLWGFVYDIGSGFLGDGLGGYVEGIGATDSIFEYETGQGPQGMNGGMVYYDFTGVQDSTQNLVVVNRAVPEPATLALMGLGLAGLGAARCRVK